MRELRDMKLNDAYNAWCEMIDDAIESNYDRMMIDDDLRDIDSFHELIIDESYDDELIIDRSFIINQNIALINDSYSNAIARMNALLNQ